MIPQETIDLIKNTATDNITEVISDFVTLKKTGSVYVGLSPFSNERTPSFTIHPAKGIFKDFSSGKGGDVIEFLMQSQKWKFTDALKYLSKKFSIGFNDNDFEYVIKERDQQKQKAPDYIHPNDMLCTLNLYHDNNLFKFLCSKLAESNVKKAFDRYMVGSVGNWLIFWQIDIKTFIRSGKFIKYLENGHRCKDSKATWQHAKTKEYKPVYPDFNLVQCFFGEHLLEIKKPVAIVESEKTAIVASVLIPKYTWLACGSKNGLNDIKCEVLKNRAVTLFPDVGCFNEWKSIAVRYNFSVSNILERNPNSEMDNGYDLADYLL